MFAGLYLSNLATVLWVYSRMNKVRALYTCKHNIVSSFYLVNSLDTSSVDRICKSPTTLHFSFRQPHCISNKSKLCGWSKIRAQTLILSTQLTGPFFKKYSPEIENNWVDFKLLDMCSSPHTLHTHTHTVPSVSPLPACFPLLHGLPDPLHIHPSALQ